MYPGERVNSASYIVHSTLAIPQLICIQTEMLHFFADIGMCISGASAVAVRCCAL